MQYAWNGQLVNTLSQTDALKTILEDLGDSDQSHARTPSSLERNNLELYKEN